MVPDFQLMYMGSTIHLQCVGGSVSIWTINGEVIKPNFIYGNNLNIINANPIHTGEYKCYAEVMGNIYFAKADIIVGCELCTCWILDTTSIINLYMISNCLIIHNIVI